MQAVISAPSVPTGKIKSFGAFGPKYEVGQVVRQLEDGDWMVEVKMVETGESAEYRLTIHDAPASPPSMKAGFQCRIEGGTPGH